MSSVFRVREVFRPAYRKGPVIVGKAPSADVSVGTRLVSAENPEVILEVIAIDFPSPKSQAEGTLAIVVQPDPGDRLHPGMALNISER